MGGRLVIPEHRKEDNPKGRPAVADTLVGGNLVGEDTLAEEGNLAMGDNLAREGGILAEVDNLAMGIIMLAFSKLSIFFFIYFLLE